MRGRGRPRRRPPTVETIQVLEAQMAFADARIADIVRRCCLDANIVESVARSCYLQGLVDGAQIAQHHAALLAPNKHEP